MKRLKRVIITIAILFFINTNVYSEPRIELTPVFQDEIYIFFKADNKLFIYQKWQPMWYIFPFTEEVSIEKIDKTLFRINNQKVLFSEFKGLLFFQETKKTIIGIKIRNFNINASHDLSNKDGWAFVNIDSKYSFEYCWRSEKVKYEINFEIPN